MNTPGSYLTIRTADCIPILLVDERLRAVAAVHAGWRGTAQGIAGVAVRALGERFQSRPQDLLAAIGPGICGKCYEVGPEVASQFGLAGRVKLDLTEVNRRQLMDAGLDSSRIFANAPCTFCCPGEFHSWRRDHVKTGRMVAAVAIRG
jgi:YfiH family protein